MESMQTNASPRGPQEWATASAIAAMFGIRPASKVYDALAAVGWTVDDRPSERILGAEFAREWQVAAKDGRPAKVMVEWLVREVAHIHGPLAKAGLIGSGTGSEVDPAIAASQLNEIADRLRSVGRSVSDQDDGIECFAEAMAIESDILAGRGDLLAERATHLAKMGATLWPDGEQPWLFTSALKEMRRLVLALSKANGAYEARRRARRERGGGTSSAAPRPPVPSVPPEPPPVSPERAAENLAWLEALRAKHYGPRQPVAVHQARGLSPDAALSMRYANLLMQQQVPPPSLHAMRSQREDEDVGI